MKKAKVPTTKSRALPVVVPPTTVEKVSAGVAVGGNQGDALCDVIRYWSHVCSNPSSLFNLKKLDWSNKLVLDSGAIQVYSNFTEFMDGESRKNQAIADKMADEGIDLQEVEGVNIEDLDPSPVLTKSTKHTAAPDSSHDHALGGDALIATQVGTNVRKARVTQSHFWDITRLLIADVKRNVTRVELPSRHHMVQCLRRVSQRVHQASEPLLTRLEQVPTAYQDRQHHTLYLVVSPNMRRSTDLAECLFSIYNNTDRGGVYDTHSRATWVRYADLSTVHPMFEKECWRDMLFKVASLAYHKSMFVNFNFHVGLHHQYLNVFEQAFELLRSEEIETVGGMTTGAIVSYFKNSLEETDYNHGRSPQWIYEFDIPDEYRVKNEVKHISTSLPTYKGMRVRFMFREDHAAWFF